MNVEGKMLIRPCDVVSDEFSLRYETLSIYYLCCSELEWFFWALWIYEVEHGIFVSIWLRHTLIATQVITFYLFLDATGGNDGSVRMFEFGHPEQIVSFRGPNVHDRVNRIRFTSLGNKVCHFSVSFLCKCCSKVIKYNEVLLDTQPYNKLANQFIDE